MGIGFRTGVRFSSPPPATRRGGRSTLRHFLSPYKDTAEVFCMATLLCRGVPLHQITPYFCAALFFCIRSISIVYKPNFVSPWRAFPVRLFVNTQSHRCDNLCVTFTNSGACPCTQFRFTLCKAVFYCLTTIQKKTCNANIGNTRFHINAHAEHKSF